jgi:phosphatidylserine synthase
MLEFGVTHTLYFLLPQIFTGLRIAIVVWALFAAILHHLEFAARLIIIGAITDFCDGWFARKLGVSSEFGTLFDYFTDYVHYSVAPTVFSMSILFPVIAGLNVMPFVLTKPLAFLSVFLIAAHVLFSPLVVNQRPESPRLKWPG